jgi:hypothetical protein
MPVKYTIDSEQRIIRTECFGPVKFTEVIDHFRELEHDPNCTQGLDVLLDLTETTNLPGVTQIGAVADELKKIHEKVQFGACAIVAGRESLFGMIKMFEIPAQRYFHVIRVFRKIIEAETWLASQKQLRRSVSRRLGAENSETI